MKKFNVIFIIVYFTVIAIPALSMPFFFNAKNTENRKLASFPSILKEERINTSFTEDLDDFVNDRIGFRQFLVSMNTGLKTGVFKHSTEDDIILGKDGWLYYSADLNDYMNIQTLSDRNINNIANSIEMINESLSDNGVTFVFTVIPNKSTVYPEYMPDTYIRSNNCSNLDALEKALGSKNVNYADVRSRLLSEDKQLYQAKDSHWTYEGALAGYDEIMKASGIEYNIFDGLCFTEKQDWESDLAVMLYSVNAKEDYQKYPEYEFKYEYTSHEKEPDSITLKTENTDENGRAVIYRDSFMNTCHRFFAENFNYVVFSRAVPYKLSTAYNEEADFVLIEIVERNIVNLATSAPVMKAPEVSRDEINDAKYVNSKDVYVYIENENNYTHIYGYVDESYLEDDNEIYVEAEGIIYKAFPIYEQVLLGNDEIKDNGFSLYIPETEERFSTDIYIK